MANDEVRRLIDALADAFASDERILSQSDRALIAELLAQVRAGSASQADAQVAQRISEALGRIVMQRALRQLGNAVVERMVGGEFAPFLTPPSPVLPPFAPVVDPFAPFFEPPSPEPPGAPPTWPPPPPEPPAP